MNHLLNLEKYPLDRPESQDYGALVERCKIDIAADGMFTLPGFLWPAVTQATADAVKPTIETEAFRHARQHNVYFRDSVPGLAENHPVLTQLETVIHTLCADQLGDSPIIRLYEWAPFAAFLAGVMGKKRLYPMDDPLARVNVQTSYPGNSLNWHFDRSEFTTTILLQAPETGGELEYRKNLRSTDEPNYDGVAAVLDGEDPDVKSMRLVPGALNVFCGVNTLHRVVPVTGNRERIVSIFSFFDRPGVVFSRKEQLGFYGRSATTFSVER